MTISIKLIPKSTHSWLLNIFSFALISVIFYGMAYYSVSDFLPSAIPVHHDDYSNYSLASGGLVWSWIRPLSTWFISVFAFLGPEWLIWTVRVLTATYIFLSWKILIEILQPRQYWITLVLFAMASLSSPIVAEYARYTGMVTHMLSGCLGLAAVYSLLKDDREESDTWLYVSVILLLLSALAKEDFVLFYAFSLAYVLFKSKKTIKKRVMVGAAGLLMSLLVVAGAKLLAASPFLGASDALSPYFIDTSPASVATTIWRYLMGAGHPAMKMHGPFISSAMIFSGIVALILMLRFKNITNTLYFVGAALTLIAPYSVLPNHVNPYYELIWLPFIIGAVYVALSEAVMTNVVTRSRAYLPSVLFAALCIALNVVDWSGRTGIAHWYDAVGSDNAKVLMLLENNKEAINASASVCVYGANSFSPWYMHSGRYLNTVMGLHTLWNVVVDKNSPLYGGFQIGAASSNGRIILSDTSEANPSCLNLLIAEPK